MDHDPAKQVSILETISEFDYYFSSVNMRKALYNSRLLPRGRGFPSVPRLPGWSFQLLTGGGFPPASPERLAMAGRLAPSALSPAPSEQGTCGFPH